MSKNIDLFDVPAAEEETERINVDSLKDWVTERLKEVFAHVAEPILLKNNGRPLFLFYFAVSNSGAKAIQLADRVVNQIIKDHLRKG